MRRTHTAWQVLRLLVPALVLVAASAAQAQEEKKLGWSDTAELALVATAGNSESSTLGLKDTLFHGWENARFQLDLGALRAKTSTFSRTAIGTGAGDFVLIEDEESKLTAEHYFLRGRYERDLSAAFYWFGGAGWERNELAGFRSRTSAVGGVGRVWLAGETARFKTDAGLTFTDQDDVTDNPAADSQFLGVRLSYDYWRRLTASTEYASVLIVDLNADETDDLRADFTNSVAVSMSERLALKAGLQLLFDHQPALAAVPIIRPDGTPTGAVAFAELDDLDSIFTVSLVASF